MSAIAYVEPQGKFAPNGKSFLPEHPAHIATSTWNRVTVATIRSGQERPYGDTINEAEILFEGGSRSSVAGCDVPFFTSPTISRVKDIVRALVGNFVETLPAGYNTRLDKLECIDEGRCYSIWFVRLITPYSD